MRALHIHEAAATEAAAAAAWYEKERPGLGSEFERARSMRRSICSSRMWSPWCPCLALLAREASSGSSFGVSRSR